MNAQKVKQIVIIDEIIHKFYELQKEIINDKFERNTSEYNFNKDVETIRDMFVKASQLYIDGDTQSKVLQLHSEINDYKSIIEKLDGFEFKINPFCQEQYDNLIELLNLGVSYRENTLENL